MVKTLRRIGIQEIFLNCKEHPRKYTANIPNVERLYSFPLRLGTRKECLLLSLLFNIRAIRQEKSKRHPNWKERSNTVTI